MANVEHFRHMNYVMQVTAMAQQSFGDISLPSALTSALGTAGTGDRSAAGLLSTFRGSFHTTGTT